MQFFVGGLLCYFYLICTFACSSTLCLCSCGRGLWFHGVFGICCNYLMLLFCGLLLTLLCPVVVLPLLLLVYSLFERCSVHDVEFIIIIIIINIIAVVYVGVDVDVVDVDVYVALGSNWCFPATEVLQPHYCPIRSIRFVSIA